MNKGYDVAIIKLANGDKVRFNTHLKPVKLEARTVPEFARYYMLGFGRLNRDALGCKKPSRVKWIIFAKISNRPS